MSIKQRIVDFISSQKISVAGFEKRCGFSNGYLKQLRRAPSYDKIESILSTFPELNRDWLLKGEGEMLIDSPTPPSAPADARPHIPANLLEVMAGGLSDTDGVNLRDLEMHPRIDSFKDYDFTISVRGDSMFPYICEGDTLAVSAIEPSQLRPGEIYVLDVMGDGAVVKRVYDEPDAQRFRLISINPDYDPYHVSKSDVRALYLVVGILRSRF